MELKLAPNVIYCTLNSCALTFGSTGFGGQGPIHTASVLYRNGEKSLHFDFGESVYTDPQKNATKTQVFESSIKSGYLKISRF